MTFQCSSASRKFLNFQYRAYIVRQRRVSVLFSEPKIPQSSSAPSPRRAGNVSVLFSEPKIPQFELWCGVRGNTFVSVLFSEPKIPQCAVSSTAHIGRRSFSALQRAENSSIKPQFDHHFRRVFVSVLFSEPKIPQFFSNPVHGSRPDLFQCSSASRKFLNAGHEGKTRSSCWFQCSSASRKFLNVDCAVLQQRRRCVSVLFSEPKIPQSSAPFPNYSERNDLVSVLFSEPKIPQLNTIFGSDAIRAGFSALQRAENSSIYLMMIR